MKCNYFNSLSQQKTTFYKAYIYHHQVFQWFKSTKLTISHKIKDKQKTHKIMEHNMYEFSPRCTAWKTNTGETFSAPDKWMSSYYQISLIWFLFKLTNRGNAKEHDQYLLILRTVFSCLTLDRLNLVFNNEVKKHLEMDSAHLQLIGKCHQSHKVVVIHYHFHIEIPS